MIVGGIENRRSISHRGSHDMVRHARRGVVNTHCRSTVADFCYLKLKQIENYIRAIRAVIRRGEGLPKAVDKQSS